MAKPAAKSVTEIVQELVDLLKAYAQQETVDPLKALGAYLAWGGLGAVLLAMGIFFVALERAARPADRDGFDLRGQLVLGPVPHRGRGSHDRHRPGRLADHPWRSRAPGCALMADDGDAPDRTEPISRDDIEAKLRELQGEAEVIGEEARSYALTAAIVVGVAIVGIAFVLGRRRGRRNRTIVEVRRI